MAELPELTVTQIHPRHAVTQGLDDWRRGISSQRLIYMLQPGATDAKWAEISKISYNLASNESDFGRSPRYKAKRIFPLGVAVYNFFRGQDTSRGYAQNKDGTTSEPYRAALEVTQRVSKQYGNNGAHWSDGTPMSTEDLTVIRYHRTPPSNSNQMQIPGDRRNGRFDYETKTGTASGYLFRYHDNAIIK